MIYFQFPLPLPASQPVFFQLRISSPTQPREDSTTLTLEYSQHRSDLPATLLLQWTCTSHATSFLQILPHFPSKKQLPVITGSRPDQRETEYAVLLLRLFLCSQCVSVECLHFHRSRTPFWITNSRNSFFVPSSTYDQLKGSSSHGWVLSGKFDGL